MILWSDVKKGKKKKLRLEKPVRLLVQNKTSDVCSKPSDLTKVVDNIQKPEFRR